MWSWWKQVFGFDFSVLEMLGTGTLEALGGHAATGIVKSVGGEDGENLSSEHEFRISFIT